MPTYLKLLFISLIFTSLNSSAQLKINQSENLSQINPGELTLVKSGDNYFIYPEIKAKKSFGFFKNVLKVIGVGIASYEFQEKSVTKSSFERKNNFAVPLGLGIFLGSEKLKSNNAQLIKVSNYNIKGIVTSSEIINVSNKNKRTNYYFGTVKEDGFIKVTEIDRKGDEIINSNVLTYLDKTMTTNNLKFNTDDILVKNDKLELSNNLKPKDILIKKPIINETDLTRKKAIKHKHRAVLRTIYRKPTDFSSLEDLYYIDGYDQYGYDVYGYDRDGFDSFGYDENGYDMYGYDSSGYDVFGFDEFGYDINGNYEFDPYASFDPGPLTYHVDNIHSGGIMSHFSLTFTIGTNGQVSIQSFSLVGSTLFWTWSTGSYHSTGLNSGYIEGNATYSYGFFNTFSPYYLVWSFDPATNIFTSHWETTHP